MHSVPRRTPEHIAWLLPSGTLFFMCGIMLGRIALDWRPLLIVLALGGCAALLSHRWMRAAAVMAMALAVGGMLSWHGYHPVLPEEGQYTIRGTVVQEIVTEETGQVQTLLSGVTLDGASAGDAHWTFYLDEDEALPEWLQPGSQVEMTAEVYHPSGRMNPGGFNFKEYLLQRGVEIGVYGADALTEADGGSLRGWLAALRHTLTLRLMDAMGPEVGAYAAAMLLGTRDFIPADDLAAFQELGIAHILSVSGYHVGVLAVILLGLLHPLPLRREFRLVLEVLLLGAYCLLTGGNAPVIRAAGLLLWREYTRLRQKQLLTLHMLCVTAVVQLSFNPTLLAGASFQLTYGAMLGLLLVYPWLKKQRQCRTAWGGKLWEAFAASMSAQLGILMPQMYWFGELPLLSVFFNMAIIPLAGLLMGLYWVMLAVLPIPGLREAVGLVASGMTATLLMAVRWLASLDTASLWTRQADVFTFAGWSLLLFCLSGLLPRKWERFRHGGILLGAALVALILIPLPEGETTYIQFSVGNADAAILQDDGMTVVIDVGEDGRTAASYLHRRRQSVEWLILTHLHIDHAGGLRALLDAGIPVAVCCLPADADVPVIDEELLPLLAELARTGTEFRTLSRGDAIDLPHGILTALWPEGGRVSPAHDANDVCLVLQAEICGTTMLLTSDLTGRYESYAALPADILKVAHHGSASSTSEEFLAAVDPALLLLSNKDESRAARMAELAGDVPLYNTETNGGIIIRFSENGLFTLETTLPHE